MAAVRWTLVRLVDDLRPHAASVPGRLLTERARALQLDIGDVWEAWVRGFANALAPQLGLRQPGLVETRRPLRWEGGVASMGSLAPDVGMLGDHRVVWIDAKYKAHLSLLARHGWRGTTELVRDAHRADLHQALAYAALVDVDRVDTVLLYPHLGQGDAAPPTAVATVASGRRRVRLVLGAIPFGFGTPAKADATVKSWRAPLAA